LLFAIEAECQQIFWSIFVDGKILKIYASKKEKESSKKAGKEKNCKKKGCKKKTSQKKDSKEKGCKKKTSKKENGKKKSCKTKEKIA